MFCAVNAFASQATFDVSGLSDAQIAELKATAARNVADAAKGGAPSGDTTTATLSLASTWGTQAAQAAEGFAKAITIAAKELGVTVNDFLHTDAGRLTAILIIWKVAGASIAKVLTHTVVYIVGLTFIRFIYIRIFTKEYHKVPYKHFFGAFSGEKQIRVPKSFSDLKNDGEWLAFWIMIIMFVGLTLIVAL